jgi:hypothetical protein
MKRIRLWIEVDVDPELLIPEADAMCKAMWNSTVEEVAGRAVRLVAREAAAGVGPGAPATDVLEVQVRERLAIVTPHSRDRVLRAHAGEDSRPPRR